MFRKRSTYTHSFHITFIKIHSSKLFSYASFRIRMRNCINRLCLCILKLSASDALHTVTSSDSKQNLKEHVNTSPVTPATTVPPPVTGNHLELPTNCNPNLLSPDILNQRRGKYLYFFLIYFYVYAYVNFHNLFS